MRRGAGSGPLATLRPVSSLDSAAQVIVATHNSASGGASALSSRNSVHNAKRRSAAATELALVDAIEVTMSRSPRTELRMSSRISL